MHGRGVVIFLMICVLSLSPISLGQNPVQPNHSNTVELVRYEKEFSAARVEAARMAQQTGAAVIFEGTSDLHYYAKEDSAPAGYRLKVEAKSGSFEFGEAVFPKWSNFFDKAQGKKVEVYVGKFVVFVPIKSVSAGTSTGLTDVEVKISGIACTSTICLTPFEKTLQGKIDYSQKDSWKEISLKTAAGPGKADGEPGYSTWFALVLAFLAGLSLNIMPCVWPVLPLIVMRLVEQAKQGKGRSAGLGLAFCLGILLFFACLAGVNIILQVFYGTVLQWGDPLRNPVFLGVMALLLVVLALFMFGVFTITVPASIAGKSGPSKGYPGAVVMGFLAAILGTPCSFGILAAAFAWAQTQPLSLATLAIMIIGVGMAVPYVVLTSMPGLLGRLPGAGRWMELFKQAIGFILLIIAVKLIAALPQVRQAGVLYFAVVLGFCVWMWGSWVSYNTKLSNKLIIRTIAVALAAAGGWLFLQVPARFIDWQKYDANLIEIALKEEKPVLIKFTADWCWNCQVAEKMVYSRGDIGRLIKEKGVLAIKADTTGKDFPATAALKNIYNEPGVPVSMLFMPGEKEPVRWHGMFFASELKSFLEKLPNR